MLGYVAADVLNKITPADISDPQEVIARAKALSGELATTITIRPDWMLFVKQNMLYLAARESSRTHPECHAPGRPQAPDGHSSAGP